MCALPHPTPTSSQLEELAWEAMETPKAVPCPRCGSFEVKSRGRVGLEGVWPDMMLIRRYRCARCGHTFETAEVSLELPDPALLARLAQEEEVEE